MNRKEKIQSGQLYHVFSKSIAGYRIFNSNRDFSRMRDMIRYYRTEKAKVKFSRFIMLRKEGKEVLSNLNTPKSFGNNLLVQIISYCLMPTHLHFILKQLKENGISTFMMKLLNSYSHYFNTKHRRKGPLWEGRFKNVLIDSDELLLHMTRYVHLNPVTAYIVDDPQSWPASSYNEYLLEIGEENKICKYGDILEINPQTYKEFVNDRIGYQRELSNMKGLLLD
ncbi:MAG: transposase [Candidatus Omnitrophota bacterium]